jgi:hypothetical protein
MGLPLLAVRDELGRINYEGSLNLNIVFRALIMDGDPVEQLIRDLDGDPYEVLHRRHQSKSVQCSAMVPLTGQCGNWTRDPSGLCFKHLQQRENQKRCEAKNAFGHKVSAQGAS